MKSKRYVPDRGHSIWLDFMPHKGREQAGRRPALVLSPASYNELVGLAVVCPITNQGKGYPFEVQIPRGLKVTGFVLSDQVKSLDWRERNTVFIGSVPLGIVDLVVERVNALLNPDE